MDMNGKMHCRMYRLAKPPDATEVQGQPAYVLGVWPRPGQSAQALEEISCADVVCIVTMDFHEERGVYTLLESDNAGLKEWLNEHLAREHAEHAAKKAQPLGQGASASVGRGQPAGAGQPVGQGASASVGRGQPAGAGQSASAEQHAKRVHVRNRVPVPTTVGPKSRAEKRQGKELRRSARLAQKG